MTSTLAGPWRLLRRRPDLARLVGAGLVSLTGDWLLAIGLSYAVYDLTGSTMASAGVFLTALLPQVLVGLVAGVLVDRWDRRRTMLVANLRARGRAAPAAARGRSRARSGSSTRCWCSRRWSRRSSLPAEQAMLPRVVDESDSAELVTANALNGQARNLARLVGGALGGVLAAARRHPAGGAGGRRHLPPRGPARAPDPHVGRGRAPRGQAAERRRPGSVRRAPRRVGGGRPGGARAPGRCACSATFWLITSFGEGIWGTLFAPYVRSVLHGGAGGARA